uniref:Uncharacterized protein n=1 Tax=Panagrellus redivivus TaxID=6233 RepID=A0A7E4ZTU9_PANRE
METEPSATTLLYAALSPPKSPPPYTPYSEVVPTRNSTANHRSARESRLILSSDTNARNSVVYPRGCRRCTQYCTAKLVFAIIAVILIAILLLICFIPKYAAEKEQAFQRQQKVFNATLQMLITEMDQLKMQNIILQQKMDTTGKREADNESTLTEVGDHITNTALQLRKLFVQSWQRLKTNLGLSELIDYFF